MKTITRPFQATPAQFLRCSKPSRQFHQSLRGRSSPLAEAPTFQETSTPPSSRGSTSPSAFSSPPPLSLLKLPTLLRSFLISAASSSSLTLTPSLRILSLLAHSSSPWLQHNRALHFILKKTFYRQFCAGETPSEVQRTVADLKDMGFQGIILAYAKEIVLEKGTAVEEGNCDEAKDVKEWKKGTIETVRLTDRDGYAALKFSGAGRSAVRQLIGSSPPSPAISQATTEICEYAKSRGVKLLFDAEQVAIQDTIDQWTLEFQRKYNRDSFALVYGTYQAYLRSSPATLAEHLNMAQQEGFTLGVKLVRGAYMASDPRHLIWATKEETDRVFDGIAESLLRRRWNEVLYPAAQASEQPPGFPAVDLILASHNCESVRKATAIRQEQGRTGAERIRLAYAQLMGMADEIGCELIMSGRNTEGSSKSSEKPSTYKYVVWGTVQECLKYLVRRAEENMDALWRARSDRNALGRELRRRLLRF
ncbi:MAG: hypothetical protein Q9207_004944 [Kuettlingeria erythrocarpa]